jgi:Zn-dependent peptidase ImmA (M78 family)
VSYGTGLFIVENTSHSPYRRLSNLAHEMAHVLLEHHFQRILFTDGGCRYHDATSVKIEQDATDLAGELLIPTPAAKRAALAPDRRAGRRAILDIVAGSFARKL